MDDLNNKKSFEEDASKILSELNEIQEKKNEILWQYKNLWFKRFDCCNHFLIISDSEYDKWEGRSYNWWGCIKCGLNNKVTDMCNGYGDLPFNVMQSYFDKKESYNIPGYHSYINLHFRRAKDMCKKILEEKPSITNEELEEELYRLLNENKEEKEKQRVRESKSSFGKESTNKDMLYKRHELFW